MFEAKYRRQFLIELGSIYKNPMIMDDRDRIEAEILGQFIFNFIHGMNAEELRQFDKLYRKWLKRTGQAVDSD